MQDFSSGYQTALNDLAAALDRGGLDALFAWGYDNAESAATRAAFHGMLEE